LINPSPNCHFKSSGFYYGIFNPEKYPIHFFCSNQLQQLHVQCKQIIKKKKPWFDKSLWKQFKNTHNSPLVTIFLLNRILVPKNLKLLSREHISRSLQDLIKSPMRWSVTLAQKQSLNSLISSTSHGKKARFLLSGEQQILLQFSRKANQQDYLLANRPRGRIANRPRGRIALLGHIRERRVIESSDYLIFERSQTSVV